MGFSVKCYSPIIFSVCCSIGQVFNVCCSEESTVKCLEGSSDIFGNGRTSSLAFENLREFSEIFGSLRKSEINCPKMAENSLIY